MVDGFEHLKRLGAQKIHDTTHISRKNIELILEKSFGELKKIQFMGFISILEREYSIDLGSLKEEYLRSVPEDEEALTEHIVPDHKAQERKLNKGLIAAIAGVVLVLVIIAFNGSDEDEEIAMSDFNTALIEETKAQMETALVEETVEEEPVAVVRHLAIIPKMNLWVGMIDLETHKRSSKMTEEAFELDAQRSWLIIMGHGQVKVEHGDEVLDLKERQRVRLLYENGVLERIDQAQFLVKNRGSDW